MDDIVEQVRTLAKSYQQSMPYLTVEYENQRIRMAAVNEKCAMFAIGMRHREPKTNSWIKSFSPGEIFFDIGANNGVYGLMAALVSGCKVYSFEPHFGSYYVIGLNIFANNLQDRMFSYPLAISDHDGYGSLFLSATYAGKSLNNFGQSRPHENPLWNATIPQAAITTTLDRFVAETGVMPNHIKVDVDGLEPQIVDGAIHVLSDPSVRSIMLELDKNDEKHMSVMPKLSALGFKRYEEDEAGIFFYKD